jgi:OOP family OmpA-OmpF porin
MSKRCNRSAARCAAITEIFAAAGAVLALGAGCKALEPVQREPASAGLPDPGPDKEYTVEWPYLGRGQDRYIRLTLGDDVTEVCRSVHPHFQFDSAEPLPQNHFELKALAECLNAPPIAKLPISLVGRTDAKGNAAYNDQLGKRRAERVKQILVESGVAADRFEVSSRGETGALGDQGLYSYGYDRRVDIVLVGLVHRPR